MANAIGRAQKPGRAGIDAARRRAGLVHAGWPGRARRPASRGCCRNGRWPRSAPGPAVALAAGRLRLRHRRLFHRRAGTASGGRRSRLALAALTIAVLARQRPFGFPLALAIAAVAAGFATATLQTARIAHPVLSLPAWSAQVAGFVEVREERERTDRIVVRVARIAAPRMREAPERVRVSVRKGTAPAVGSFVAFKAHLSPPLQPLRPGGYDFARDMYFQRIGASGFVLGAIRPATAPSAPSLRLRYAAIVDGMREAHRPAHPRGAARRPRRDRLGADHRQTRCDLDAGQRRHVCFEPGARAVDLRLSHGGGGRHRVLFHPRRACADAGARQPPPDQEMGGRRRAVRPRRSICVLSGAERRDATLLHHDRDRADRRHGRPAGADLAHPRGRRLRRAAARAGGDRASELPDVVCRDARADRGLSTRPAVARRSADTPLGARVALWGGARDRRR